jgi:hypothetical protein
MRESRQSGSEGGAAQANAPSLPLSVGFGTQRRRSFLTCPTRSHIEARKRTISSRRSNNRGGPRIREFEVDL